MPLPPKGSPEMKRYMELMRKLRTGKRKHHIEKGSEAAKAWGLKMKEARAAKKAKM